MSQEDRNQDELWMSMIAHEQTQLPAQFATSVIMEDGLGAGYAGIRLIIQQVVHPEELGQLRSQFGVTDIPCSILNISNIKKQARNANHQNFCTVVLGIEIRASQRPATFTIKPMQQALAARLSRRGRSLVPLSLQRLGIVLDCFLPWDPATYTSYNAYSTSLSLLLSSPGRWGARERIFDLSESLPVRVLRTRRQFRRHISLPPDIIQLIGCYLSRKSDLLSASLVNKSWLPIIRIFFRNFGWHKDTYVYNLESFARAVDAHTQEWGSLITCINLQHLKVVELPRYYVHSIGDIMKCTPNLTVLVFNLFVLTWAKGIIGTLEHLEQLICNDHGMKGQSSSSLLSIQQIQETISRNKKLRTLCLSGVGRGRTPPEREPAPTKEYQVELEHLQIQDERISQEQLTNFIRPFNPPVLRSLDLENVEGISPDEFLGILLALSTSLHRLRIVNCSSIVIREEDNVSVLDQAIDSMESLHLVELRGSIMTQKIVSCSLKPGGRLVLYASGLTLKTGHGLDILETLRCFGSGWPEITVFCTSGSFSQDHVYLPEDKAAEVKVLEEGKGLKLECKPAPEMFERHFRASLSHFGFDGFDDFDD